MPRGAPRRGGRRLLGGRGWVGEPAKGLARGVPGEEVGHMGETSACHAAGVVVVDLGSLGARIADAQ